MNLSIPSTIYHSSCIYKNEFFISGGKTSKNVMIYLKIILFLNNNLLKRLI